MPTPKTHAARTARHVDPAVLARRLDHHGEHLSSLRIRMLNMEATLSQWPALRRFLRTLPRNLKALNPELIPFAEACWSRGERARSRVAATVAYLRAHPGALAYKAARNHGVKLRTLARSHLYRDLRLERAQAVKVTQRHGPTGGVDRALRCLATQQPRGITEVARQAGVHASCLYASRRFRAAWNAYLDAGARAGERLGPVSGGAKAAREPQAVDARTADGQPPAPERRV